MNKESLAELKKNPLFAERETIREALEYSNALIKGLAPMDRIYAYTAIHVVTNTILKVLKNEESS